MWDLLEIFLNVLLFGLVLVNPKPNGEGVKVNPLVIPVSKKNRS